MNLNNIDLNLFLVFNAIYNERNLTKAANILCITQPAVSNALKRFRSIVNDPLFIRTPTGMAPTPVAESMITPVQQAIQLLDLSVTSNQVFDPKTADKNFVFNMNDMVEIMLLPSLMSILSDRAPKASLETIQIDRANIEKELTSGELDFAIDVPHVASPQLKQRVLIKDRYVCVARKDHPLIGSSITLEQYLSMGHIHISSRRRGRGFVDIALQKMGINRNIQMRAQHHWALPNLLANTNLLSIMPATMAKSSTLKVVELPFAIEPVEWRLYWHKSADSDPRNIWMRDMIDLVVNNHLIDSNSLSLL
ncbi:LysR family transcriptional regulator [Colwellia sp. KU-HH00111]|uniref:LysR family transcriptional regulator n=1 Tax=Colwellia sp. KU-HH00111 TaxID=3127652 RepID=UPI0031089FD6